MAVSCRQCSLMCKGSDRARAAYNGFCFWCSLSTSSIACFPIERISFSVGCSFFVEELFCITNHQPASDLLAWLSRLCDQLYDKVSRRINVPIVTLARLATRRNSRADYFFFKVAPPSSGKTNRFARISTIKPASTTSPKRCVGGKFDNTKIAKPAAKITSE